MPPMTHLARSLDSRETRILHFSTPVVGEGRWYLRRFSTSCQGGASFGAAITYGGVTLTNAVTGTGKMVLDAAPSFATTVGVGGATAAASGSGISFPATQSASSDANTLDDFERGTWTPAIGGTATYTTQVGRYVKIGKWVWITGYLAINSIGTGSSTTLSGLPFASANTGQSTSGCVSEFASTNVSVSFFGCVVTNNASTMTFNSADAGVTTTQNGRGIFTNSTAVRFSVFYEAAT